MKRPSENAVDMIVRLQGLQGVQINRKTATHAELGIKESTFYTIGKLDLRLATNDAPLLLSTVGALLIILENMPSVDPDTILRPLLREVTVPISEAAVHTPIKPIPAVPIPAKPVPTAPILTKPIRPASEVPEPRIETDIEEEEDKILDAEANPKEYAETLGQMPHAVGDTVFVDFLGGMKGKVMAFDMDDGEVVVKLTTGEVKSFSPGNVMELEHAS